MFKSNSHKIIQEASSDKVCKYISVLLKRIKNKKLVSQLSLCHEKKAVIALNMERKPPLFLNQLEIPSWIGPTGEWWAPNYYHLSAMRRGIIRALPVIRACQQQCSRRDHNTSCAGHLTAWTKWCPFSPEALMFCCRYVYGGTDMCLRNKLSFQSGMRVTQAATHPRSPLNILFFLLSKRPICC